MIHTNPDKTVVSVPDGTIIGNGVRIAEGTAFIGFDVRLCDYTNIRGNVGDRSRIGRYSCVMDGAVVSSDVRIGEEVTIGRDAEIENGAVIETGVQLPDFAHIGKKGRVRKGRYFRVRMTNYTVEAYDGPRGIVLRHGCKTLLLREWTEKKQRELCKKFEPGCRVTAAELRAAVEAAKAFFKGRRASKITRQR